MRTLAPRPIVSSYYSLSVSADPNCASQGIQTYLDVSWIIKVDSCASFVPIVIPAGTLLSTHAASCAAQIIDEFYFELRYDICRRGRLRLVDHCGGLLRLDIANAAYCASLIIIIDEASRASTYRFFVVLIESQCRCLLRFARYSNVP